MGEQGLSGFSHRPGSTRTQQKSLTVVTSSCVHPRDVRVMGGNVHPGSKSESLSGFPFGLNVDYPLQVCMQNVWSPAGDTSFSRCWKLQEAGPGWRG